jgi:hypothetical protein
MQRGLDVEFSKAEHGFMTATDLNQKYCILSSSQIKLILETEI